MNLRSGTDLIFLSVLLAFRFIHPSWGQFLLLLAATAGVFFLLRKEPLKERLTYLSGRVLCGLSVWIIPYHAALFNTAALIGLEHFGVLSGNSGIRPSVNRSFWLRALWMLLGLIGLAWFCHFWSTFSLPFRGTFFRIRWAFTIPLFAAVYTGLGLLPGFFKEESKSRWEAPHPAVYLLIGQFLLVWISRVSDFRIHLFSHFVLSALFMTAATTFIFYLTDMIGRRDSWKIFLVQYALFLVAGNRAFVVFLIVFCAYYLIRRFVSEQAGSGTGDLSRTYQKYFDSGTLGFVLLPFSIACLFLISHRIYSQLFLTVFAASWLPILSAAAQPLERSGFNMRFHEAVARKLPSRLSGFWTHGISFAVLVNAGILLLGLLLTLFNRFPWRVLWLYPLLWSILASSIAGVRRFGLKFRFQPEVFWSSLACAAGAAFIDITFFRS